MKFHAPRSVSPSPERGIRKPRGTSTYGLYSDLDSEDYYSEVEESFDLDSDVESASSSSASSSTFELVSDINKLSLRPRHIKHTPLEERQIEETISAIRLRTRYHDPYEEWEKGVRKDALSTARKQFSEHEAQRTSQQEQKHRTQLQQLSARYAAEASSVKQRSEEMRLRAQREEMMLKEQWKKREKELWDRIEAVIKAEEEKLAKKLEEERKIREEEERKRKEEELRRRLIEEKKLKEEADRLKAEAEKKKAEEEQLQREKEEAEQKKKMEEKSKEGDEEENKLRQALQFGPANDDWRVARTNLLNLKTGPVAFVKTNKEYKAECGRLRRLITPRIGQLTNDAESIARITKELLQIMKPPTGRPHDTPIYITLCSSLAKSILLQAETEVVAEPRIAEALAQVAFSLCETLDNFAPIFFSKLVQRCGGWPIPIVPPSHNIDNQPWSSREEYTKVSGWRKSMVSEGLETTKDRSLRISAVMRVYFHIIKITPSQKPLDSMFHLSRLWTWFARITSDNRLLQDSLAPWLIHTALDVYGLEACNIWGKQWIKMLMLIHEGVTTGYDNSKLIGGDSAESASARTRVMFTLSNIINGVKS